MIGFSPLTKLKVLDLFSGIGGFSRGFEATGFFETVCFVENEPYCQAVLKHHWPEVPILGDIKNVKEPDLPTRPDVICGGFPCQPFSHAGRQQAQDDPRHLWPEMFRLIRECRPTWVVGENVAGIINLGLDEVLADLEGEGYATRTFNIPACAVGAPHIRQRIWIVAHADSESEPDGTFDGNAGQRQLGFDFVADSKRTRTGVEEHTSSGQKRECSSSSPSKILRQGNRTGGSKGSSASGADVADPKHQRHKERMQPKAIGNGSGQVPTEARPEEWWEFEPDVGRVVDGLPNRVPQLRALGNSIVPQIAQKIGQAIRVAHDG